MGLRADQIAFRRRVIGGSDANIIMGGDDATVIHLWQVKRGEAEPEDLSDILPVQMGTATESFNRFWYTKKTGRQVTDDGGERLSFTEPFMGCTLDGLTTTRGDELAVFEAKHVSAFAKEDEILARYLPQLTHNMLVCELRHAVLSVFYGNHKWDYYEVELDPVYASQLVEAERHFWACVESGEPPRAVQIDAPKVSPTRIVDMTGNNAWAAHAGVWADNALAAKAFEKAAKALKELIEPDVTEAFGHGIRITRSKAGALTIKGA
jgi:predicted phage-related endonuclease